MSLWTKRKFWDGTEAIFVNGAVYDLDSPELADIIVNKVKELSSDTDEWLKLNRMRLEYIHGKKNDSCEQ